MINPSRVKKCHTSDQGELLPVYPSDLVSEDHLARVVNEVIDMLDLTVLYKKYSKEGGELFHPKSMLKILFYGYSQGDRSSRRLSRRCREDFVYMYLAHNIKPDFRTISEFRKNNLDILKTVFKQIVYLCYKLGMINLGRISLDGSKIKANASNGKIVEKDRLNKELNEIEKEIAAVLDEAESIDKKEDETYGKDKSGDELPAKLQKANDRKQEIKSLLVELEENNLKKMSITEKESRFMKTHGRIELCYNAQVLTENQVILVDNVDNNEDDREALIPMITELEQLASELTGKQDYPLEDKEVAADSGYESGDNLKYLSERKIDAYVASQFARTRAKEARGEIAPRPFTKDKFTYHADDNYYACPAGERLEYHRSTTRKKTNVTTDYYKCQACPQCAFKKECVTSKTGFRQVSRFPGYDPYREQIDAKLTTPEGKKIMRHRATDVEPTFGQMKETIFRRSPFLLRGIPKVRGEFRLVSIAHNIKKIAKHLKVAKNSDNMVDLADISLNLT